VLLSILELISFRIFTTAISINPPFRCIFPAMIYWRIAHARMYSGTINAQRNNGILYVTNSTNGLRIHLSNRPDPGLSAVDDIFGCRETQVQREIVDKQLQMIFQRDRVCIGSPQEQGSRVSINGAGTASPKPLWRMAYTRRKKIMMISQCGKEDRGALRVRVFYLDQGQGLL
jgi:hypothetical protein